MTSDRKNQKELNSMNEEIIRKTINAKELKKALNRAQGEIIKKRNAIKLLEKEKNNLRENLLQQNKKIVDLRSKITTVSDKFSVLVKE